MSATYALEWLKWKRWKITVVGENAAQLELSQGAEGKLSSSFPAPSENWQGLLKLSVPAVRALARLLPSPHPREVKMCSPEDTY